MCVAGRFREDEVRRLTPDVILVDTDFNESKIEEFCMNFQEEEDDNSDKKRGIAKQEEDDSSDKKRGNSNSGGGR